jgi:hypothetical protein
MPPWALSPGYQAPALRWGPRQPLRGTEGDLPTSGGTLESAVACETRVLGPMASRSSPALAPGAKRLPRGCARGYRTSKGTRSRARAQAGTCGGLRLGGPGEGGPAPRRSGAAPRLGPPASDSLPWREPAARSRLAADVRGHGALARRPGASALHRAGGAVLSMACCISSPARARQRRRRGRGEACKPASIDTPFVALRASRCERAGAQQAELKR